MRCEAATCATARTRIRRPRGIRGRSGGLGAVDDSPGQGAVVHEPARSRRRRAHRARVHRAGGGRDQAHESVRRGDRRVSRPTPTCARATPIRSSAFGGIVGLNRADRRRRRREAITSTFIEAVIAPVGRRRGATRSSRRRPNMRVVTADFDAFDAADGGDCDLAASSAASSAALLVAGARSRHRGARAVAGTDGRSRRVVTKRQPTAEEWDGAAIRVARLRAREVERGDLHRRRSHAGGRRRADEPRRCGEGRGDEGRRRIARGDRSPRPTPSSRSATVSTPSPTPARPPSSSRADRSATRR